MQTLVVRAVGYFLYLPKLKSQYIQIIVISSLNFDCLVMTGILKYYCNMQYIILPEFVIIIEFNKGRHTILTVELIDQYCLKTRAILGTSNKFDK